MSELDSKSLFLFHLTSPNEHCKTEVFSSTQLGKLVCQTIENRNSFRLVKGNKTQEQNNRL